MQLLVASSFFFFFLFFLHRDSQNLQNRSVRSFSH